VNLPVRRDGKSGKRKHEVTEGKEKERGMRKKRIRRKKY